jgi:predicted ArsR family transcriptional regulator
MPSVVNHGPASGQADLAVIDSPQAATTLLDPLRARLLAALTEPGSATTIATRLGLTRQQANYHLRALETAGLLELVELRQRRGFTERVVRATARGYVVSPAVLGALAADPARIDRLSARYLIAVAARAVREVAGMLQAATAADKQLPTLTIDTDLRLASAATRAAFTAELADAVRTLVGKYHDEAATGGRWHRLVLTAYPTPPEEES